MMNGAQKLQEYIKYREDRLNQLEQVIINHSEKGGVERENLYEALYGSRKLEGPIKSMAYNNLD